MARINYAKQFTIDHDIQVCEFGDVHKDHVKHLKELWLYVDKSTGRIESNRGCHMDDDK
jgi:hypothetical protein